MASAVKRVMDCIEEKVVCVEGCLFLWFVNEDEKKKVGQRRLAYGQVTNTQTTQKKGGGMQIDH